MTITDLAQLVKNMRHAQRDYFKSRDPYNLQTAKKLEAEVDNQVGLLLNEPTTCNPQPATDNLKLF